MSPELRVAIHDAIYMFKNIAAARQLPPMAAAQAQYVALGNRLAELMAAEHEPALDGMGNPLDGGPIDADEFRKTF